MLSRMFSTAYYVIIVKKHAVDAHELISLWAYSEGLGQPHPQFCVTDFAVFKS